MSLSEKCKCGTISDTRRFSENRKLVVEESWEYISLCEGYVSKRGVGKSVKNYFFKEMFRNYKRKINGGVEF